MTHVLDVYYNGLLVGKLAQGPTDNLSFTYDINYVRKPHAYNISVSLPISPHTYEGNKVKAFFSGFLPDDIVRYRLARYLGISEKNAFALLEIIGGECAGALSVYPEGQKPSEARTSDTTILDDKKLQKILGMLEKRPLLVGEEGLRLSLAGAQDKIAVRVIDGQIALSKGTAPTSHILKPEITGIKDSVHNEFFCMRLAGLVGIPTPHTEMRYLGNRPYLLIERYDRIQDENRSIKRLHQEDFCQALGIMPELKYECEGGPSVKKCLEVLQRFSAQPAADCLAFIEKIIFNYLIGNADAHGKNFSLLYKGPIPTLAPAYDLLSTAVYPNLSRKMAMKIGGKYDANIICLRHWHSLVPDTSLAKKNLEKLLLKLANHCLEKSLELPSHLAKENINSVIFNKICALIKERALQIKKELKKAP